MYCGRFNVNKDYFNFTVDDDLPLEGKLEGIEGAFYFKLVSDGIAIYNSTLLNSGFLCPGSVNNIFVPKTINNIPVVELHQTINIQQKRYANCCIEGGSLKRLFLDIGLNAQELNIIYFYSLLEDTNGDSLTNLKQVDQTIDKIKLPIELIFDSKNIKQSDLAINIDFDTAGTQIEELEHCAVRCSIPIILKVPKTKELAIFAPKTYAKTDLWKQTQKLSSSGIIYPYPTNSSFSDSDIIKLEAGCLYYEDSKILIKRPPVEYDIDIDECDFPKTIDVLNRETKIEAHAFAGNPYLESIVIPAGITKIGNGAFKGCYNLKYVEIPNSVTYIGNAAFADCIALKEIVMPDSITYIGDGAFFKCHNLKNIVIPKNLTKIKRLTFYGCIELTKIHFPEHITEIEDSAFAECFGLISVTAPYSLRADQRAFANCYRLVIHCSPYCRFTGTTAITPTINIVPIIDRS